MQKRAKQFIDMLVAQQLLAPDIIEELRRQISESKTKLTPELLAKLLVDNGHLTKFQATKLISEIKADDDVEAVSADTASADQVDAEDELGFAPDEDDEVAEDTSRQDDVDVAPVFLDDEPDAIEVAVEDVVEVTDAEVVEVDAVDVVDAEPIGAIDAVSDDAFDAMPRPKAVRPEVAKANPWDSFRILGVGLLLALVSVAGFFLVRAFWRGNAETKLKLADEAYEQRSYETAADMYGDFSEVFPAHEQASYARVRSALASLRSNVENVPDPLVGLTTALEVLPPLTEESELTEQRPDLAGALIRLADNFNQRADRTEENEDRKALMTEMDKLMQLIDNPQFVGRSEKDQQAPALQKVYEDRKRILREINRDEELVAALAAIDTKLEQQDVLGAYEVRRELTRKYPLLRTAEGLVQRVARASQVQQTLVHDVPLDTKISTDGITPESGGRIVLANRSGGNASDLAGKTIFVKVKGSVYALNGETGDVLWRKFVGQEFANDPIPVEAAGGNDVLVCDPEQGMVTRLVGATGEIQWSVDFGKPVWMPTVEGEDLFIATFDGQVASLDIEGGQTKWAVQLPQPIAVRPSAAFGKDQLFVAAEHSNLYVLARDSGRCEQVFYLENAAGSISVPPMQHMGQLFVFENRNSDTAKVRVFELADGLIKGESQSPYLLSGNIVVPPQADRRRLVILSDLGECLVLDVEPTAESQKVTDIARIPKSSYQPQVSWVLASENRVWIANSRLSRFDLQVTLQKLKRTWGRNDGDTFTGPLQLIEETLVHTRILRGNRGVRVEAIEAQSGEPLWSNDLGVPVSLIVDAGGRAFDVVNSQAAYYRFSAERLLNQATANPGQGKPGMALGEPTKVEDRHVFLNQANSNQIGVYQPDGKRLRLLSANFGAASPSCQPVAVDGNIAVGLDNGQFVMIDPDTGAQTTSPYQPTLEPGKRVQWNDPVHLGDSKSLVVASSLQVLARLSIGSSLRVLKEVDLEQPLGGPLAAVGAVIAAVEVGPTGDSLLLFDAATLMVIKRVALTSSRVSGPYAVADGYIVQTRSGLVKVSDEGQEVWQLEAIKGQLVGGPVEDGNKLVFATVSGQLMIVDSTSGQVSGTVDARQPFSSRPLLRSGGVLVGGDEGVVLALPIPNGSAEER